MKNMGVHLFAICFLNPRCYYIVNTGPLKCENSEKCKNPELKMKSSHILYYLTKGPKPKHFPFKFVY